jgi:hypothetical protein
MQGLRLQKLAPRETLICDSEDLARGREQPGVSSYSAHEVCIAVVNFSVNNTLAPLM